MTHRVDVTTSIGAVHTSGKADGRLSSVAIRIRDPDRHQNLTTCSLAHCQPSLKISCKSVRTSLRKVANRQTNKETDKETDKQTMTITYPPWRR